MIGNYQNSFAKLYKPEVGGWGEGGQYTMGFFSQNGLTEPLTLQIDVIKFEM